MGFLDTNFGVLKDDIWLGNFWRCGGAKIWSFSRPSFVGSCYTRICCLAKFCCFDVNLGFDPNSVGEECMSLPRVAWMCYVDKGHSM